MAAISCRPARCFDWPPWPTRRKVSRVSCAWISSDDTVASRSLFSSWARRSERSGRTPPWTRRPGRGDLRRRRVRSERRDATRRDGRVVCREYRRGKRAPPATNPTTPAAAAATATFTARPRETQTRDPFARAIEARTRRHDFSGAVGGARGRVVAPVHVHGYGRGAEGAASRVRGCGATGGLFGERTDGRLASLFTQKRSSPAPNFRRPLNDGLNLLVGHEPPRLFPTRVALVTDVTDRDRLTLAKMCCKVLLGFRGGTRGSDLGYPQNCFRNS